MRQQNIIITGAAGGLGLTLCETFIASNWRVWGTYNNTPFSAQMLAQLGPNFYPIHLDLRQEQSIVEASTLIQNQLKTLGEQLDVVLNNAAWFNTGPLLEIAEDDLAAEYRINVIGPILMAKYFKTLLRHKDEHASKIINISSYISKVPMPFIGSYSGTKAALNMVTDTLRYELLPYNIRVINVLLGMVKTGIMEKQLEKLDQYAQSEYLPYLKLRAQGALKLAEKGCTTAYAARKIIELVQDANPNDEYLVAQNPFMLRLAAKLSQTDLFKWAIKKQYFTLNMA